MYIDQLIEEDVPYVDLTTDILGIGSLAGEMEYFTREACVLCGSEVVERIMEKLHLEVTFMLPSGTELEAGAVFFRVKGTAAQLHMAWKVCLNVFDHCSAIATKTHGMVSAVHAVNPHCQILTTRKSMPGTKPLVTSAILAGGAFPHRLGLSETVLVFDHHIKFLGGFDTFLAQLDEVRHHCVEKKLFVEADAEQAVALAKAGVDGIQLDKIPAGELAELVKELRAIDPRLTLIAAGGVNPSNAVEYAQTGVDGIATTALFTAKPLDMSVRMTPEVPLA